MNDLKGWVGLNSENTFGAFKELLSCSSNEILMSFYQVKIDANYKPTLVNKLVEILLAQIQKGVCVKIILNNNFYIPSLMSITKLAYNRFREIGADVKLHHASKMLHSKLIIVDGRITFIGSQNLTNTGVGSNSEAGLILNSVEIANFFKEYFYKMWSALK